MKQSLTLVQNNIHSNSEVLNISLERRSNELRAVVESVITSKVYWHDLVSTLPVKDQIKLKFTTLYYTFSSPDAAINVLFGNASDVMCHPTPVSKLR